MFGLMQRAPRGSSRALDKARNLAGGATCRRIGGSSSEASAGGIGTWQMPTTFKTAAVNYLRVTNPARGTRAEYQTTLRKRNLWGRGVPIEKVGRKEVGKNIARSM